MKTWNLFLCVALLGASAALAERPLIGDPIHGATLVKKARVDGNWINQYSDNQWARPASPR